MEQKLYSPRDINIFLLTFVNDKYSFGTLLMLWGMFSGDIHAE